MACSVNTVTSEQKLLVLIVHFVPEDLSPSNEITKIKSTNYN